MCELLEKARVKQGNVSYYEIAKRLKVSDQLVRKWKDNKSQPNGLNTLKLAEMAEVSTSEAIKLLQSGYANLSLVLVTGFGSTLAVALFYATGLCILCKIKGSLNIVRMNDFYKRCTGFGMITTHAIFRY